MQQSSHHITTGTYHIAQLVDLCMEAIIGISRHTPTCEKGSSLRATRPTLMSEEGCSLRESDGDHTCDGTPKGVGGRGPNKNVYAIK